jgi:CBS domain-containing protein
MRAKQIMTRDVVTVQPETPIVEAARLMLEKHISGLPFVDAQGKLVGIVSQGDFLRRAEIGTQRRRSSWLQFFIGPGRVAAEFVHERGRKVREVMTDEPCTITEDTELVDIVDLMEKKNIKRLPVLRDGRVAGIVTRTNLLQAVANVAGDVPTPTRDDDLMRERVTAEIEKNDWRPFGLGVTARDGVVHLHGVITDWHARDAAIVAAENVQGVKEVHDHLCWVEPMTGAYLNSPEDEKLTG